jgi:atypical dual specificity phosphatase
MEAGPYARFEDLVGYTWIRPDEIAAGPLPGPAERDHLAGRGFTVLINLTFNPYADPRFEIHTLPIPDGGPPQMSQLVTFCRIVDDALGRGVKVYVHCFAGCGRTGTMLAGWLARRERLTADEAIERLRELRPCSVENRIQEAAVAQWVEHLRASA